MIPSTSRLALGLALGIALGLFGPVALAPSSHAAEPDQRLVYGGRLQDAQGRPIGGVFPLTFNFYAAEKGGRATWTESHFVAVDNGVYAVELGSKKPLPKNLKLDRVWLGVALSGGTELAREKLDGASASAAATPAAPATPAPAAPATPTTPAPATPPGPTVGAPPAKSTGSYAELAGFAYEAERAKSADAIGGMTAQEIKNLAKTVTTPAKPKIGATKRYTEQVGGTGGNPYTLQCPPGYVVTGIKGGAAAYMDSIVLICSPLE